MIDDIISEIPEALSRRDKLKRKKSHFREYLEAFLMAIFVAFILRGFVVEAFKIPSGSMIPTLLVGDHLFVNKFAYGLRFPFTKKWITEFHPPKRGDVVVFVYPDPNPVNEAALTGLASWLYSLKGVIGEVGVNSIDEALGITDVDYIKRVIGLPGDKISFKDHVLTVNGERIDTIPVTLKPAQPGEERVEVEGPADLSQDEFKKLPVFKMRMGPAYSKEMKEFNFLIEKLGPVSHWVQYEKEKIDIFERDEFEVTVPEGKFFVMGDNRDHSSDSRVWGFAPMENLKGRAMFIWFSPDEENGSFPWNIRWNRFGKWIH